MPQKEIELTKQYQPIIAQACFDKFFDEKKELSAQELELKNHLQNLFKRALGCQTANLEALALVARVDEIKSQEDLYQIFAHIELENLKLIDKLWLGGENNINPNLSLEFVGERLSATTSQNLQSFVDDTGFSGSLVISQDGAKYEAHSENVSADTSFSTHSVGKLFTGVLAIEALRQGILEEDQLHQPVKLEESVLALLPENVREYLKTTTLHQLMTHQSGLENYLVNYQKAVGLALNSGEEVPAIERPEDYLKFAEAEIKALPYVDEKGNIVESHYSNLGSLLVGLAIQNAYNEKHPGSKLTYDEILAKHVLEPAGVRNFSAQKPENACTNARDLVAPHIAGSPAGGYWTDAESLNNFGSWLCDKWQDSEFQRLTKEYGQEFYYPKSGMLAHGGSIESSCSYLMAFVETGIVYAGLSNQPINTHVIAAGIENQVVSHFKKLEAEEKQPPVQAGNLNAVEAARNFKDDPKIIERYTVFNPQNVYRSAAEVLELHEATGVDIMPRGNATNPGDIIGVGLICFRPERIAKQLTVASINMQAKIDEESFPKIVDDVFDNYVVKEMENVSPQVNQMRDEIERNVEEALKALQENPEISTEGNEVLTKVKEARDKIRQKAEGKIPPLSEEFINAIAAKYATDLLYNQSPAIFKLVEDAVARGMKQDAKKGKYEPLSQHPNNERVAIVVAGGPASGKTQATEMALHSLADSKDVMAFSTDQLRTLVSPGEAGGPAFTDLEANLVFRQIIGKMDRAMKADAAPTILSEGTSLNPGAINHLLTGGAKVYASLISIPAEAALERAGKRAASDKSADQGRSYLDEYLLGLHKQDGAALPNITSQLQGKNVLLSIFDNNVERGQSPELIGRINLQTMEMEIYNVQKLAQLEQKGKIDPTQSKAQGMYSPDDKLPENNMSFLTDALKKFSVTFKDGEKGEEYATSKPGEKLTITNQALFDLKQENPYDKALTSQLLEETKKAEAENSWVKRLGLDKAENPESFVEAAKAKQGEGMGGFSPPQ